MSQSQHRALRARIASLLDDEPAVAGGRIHEQRPFPLPKDAPAQVHVNLAGAEPDDPAMLTGAPVDWNTDFEIVIKTRGDADISAEDRADDIWVEVYARVMADKTIGGLAGGLTPAGMVLDSDEADTDVARITWRFSVMHRTSANTLS